MSLNAKRFLNSINFKYWWLHPYKNSVSELMQQYADEENEKLYFRAIDAEKKLEASENVRAEALARISELSNELEQWRIVFDIHPKPLKWIEMYAEYQDLLTKEDVTAWWQSAFEICNEERKKLKNDLPRP